MTNSNLAYALKGMDQDHRLPAALEEGYFNVDEMTFEDLLAASVEFASSLKYYNSGAIESGNWRSFLASNEIVIMALIIHRDITSLRKRISSGRSNSAGQLFAVVLPLIEDLNSWLKDLNRSESLPARDLAALIERLIYSSLLAEAHNVGKLLEYFSNSDEEMDGSDYPRLSSIWEIQTENVDEGSQYRRAVISEIESDVAAIKLLTRSTFEFLNAFDNLKSHCQVLLPQALKTESHDPAISLFITFLKLYQYAQENVNSFTQRHLDFYYREILRTHGRQKDPETTVLTFEIPEGADPIQIEAGRNFTCAKDEYLKDVLFETSEELLVSDARVAALHTLNFTREEMITPECDMDFVTKIQRQDIPLELVYDDYDNELSWPLFGDAVTSSKHSAKTQTDADMGIAIASNVLFLDEGDRKIILSIDLNDNAKPISSYIASLVEVKTRKEFKASLYALSLASLKKEDSQVLKVNLSDDSIARIMTAAEMVDRSDSPKRINVTTGEELSAISCADLFTDVLELVDATAVQADPLQHRLLHADSQEEFLHGLGDIVRFFLLENVTFGKLLDGSLDNAARELGCEKSLKAVKQELLLGRDRLFKKYLGSAFVIDLSIEDGWYRVSRYDVLRGPHDDSGFKLVFNISPDAPAICGCSPDIHGEGWDTELPLLKCSLNPEASLNVYSLLEKYDLEEIGISAEAHGVRNVVVYNNISQLDPSKPFYPFGPNPSTNSYFALASPEAARKHIDALCIHLHWGELPSGEEGFYGHYQGYPSKYRNESFTAKVTVLNSGSWQPVTPSQIQVAPLFQSAGRKLSEHQLIDVDSVEHLKPVDIDQLQEDFDLGLRTRSGFIKLTLASPGTAFGHQEYPLRLTETIEANSKKKMGKRNKLPKSPYTPLLNKLSVDYIASSTISMRTAPNEKIDAHSEQVYRIHPFGVEKIYPDAGRSEKGIFKPFEQDGHLLIGVSASEAPGRLSLYFSLADDSVRSKSGAGAVHSWSVLGSTGWEPLRKDQIVSDGTKGFLSSGIVTLELPKDLSNRHPDMPGDLYWLKLSSDNPSESFCSLRQLKTHAVTLRRATDEAVFDWRQVSRAALQWRPVTSIPGMSSVNQPDGFIQSADTEDRRQLNTRISERIRHRSRAVSAWDYERLILQKFPMVGKAVCFPNRQTSSLHQVPGHLLVVVTPRISNPDDSIGKSPKLSAVYLNDIHDYVSSLGSAFAHVEVANPVYEWVQVRCAVVFEKYAQGTNYSKILNHDICQFLNPFAMGGYGLDLSSPMKREDIYSHIYNQDYVSYVTDFSMLHITRSADGYYKLDDTVRNEIVEESADIVPTFPWSLMVPLKRHHIEVATQIEPIAPEVTGIRELEIGNTFIIGGM
ncbi:MAG: baseplate J/gp47 family protein [Pseudomonadales bacterium]|nr:baseplate J/gp47 family protein [Pseudomonadales bacterium]